MALMTRLDGLTIIDSSPFFQTIHRQLLTFPNGRWALEPNDNMWFRFTLPCQWKNLVLIKFLSLKLQAERVNFWILKHKSGPPLTCGCLCFLFVVQNDNNFKIVRAIPKFICLKIKVNLELFFRIFLCVAYEQMVDTRSESGP